MRSKYFTLTIPTTLEYSTFLPPTTHRVFEILCGELRLQVAGKLAKAEAKDKNKATQEHSNIENGSSTAR